MTWHEFGHAAGAFFASPARVLRAVIAAELLFVAGLVGFFLGRLTG